MAIRVEDESNVDKYLNIFKELASKELQIGIFGEDNEEDEEGNKMLMIARVHEFGCKIEFKDHSINIPERSFIRAGFDENYKDFQKKAEKLLGMVLDLKIDVDTFYKTLGVYITNTIQEYMIDLDTPPNAPSTIAQKGDDNPLIDDGHLKDAITYKVK